MILSSLVLILERGANFFFCNCGDTESQSCTFEDPLPGLKVTPGLKRKLSSFQMEEMVSSDAVLLDSISPYFILNSKKSRLIDYRPLNWEDNSPGMDITKQNNSLGSMKSPCAVEGCLSRGFAGLFSQLVPIYNLTGRGESLIHRAST
ncbi:hypothetical protein OIU84_015478 [Salix udensis]|uniref:Uncharacterized protein n=1 Tax=Salix udensis TaxID=889485 RepID=A0AAD6NSL6_9ROSI|nr:hypothetical protein OIU84_015478 [Salix udensis]